METQSEGSLQQQFIDKAGAGAETLSSISVSSDSATSSLHAARLTCAALTASSASAEERNSPRNLERLAAACREILEVCSRARRSAVSRRPSRAFARSHRALSRRATLPLALCAQCLGEDPFREGLVKTPLRMAKSLLSMTAGSTLAPSDVVSDALFSCASREMVLVRDLPCESLCEHHLLPFTGRVHIAYLPRGRVIGLSKLSRLVECFSRRLQLQERLTSEIAEALCTAVDARGVAVFVECECVSIGA